MDVIVIGVYNIEDKNKLEKIVSETNSLEIVWEYDAFNIEAKEGVKLLEESFKLFLSGILVEKERGNTFSSYPLIYEVSQSSIGINIYPKLFTFFDLLEKSAISKMILAFGDEWNRETTVKIEKCNYSNLKKRLNSNHVWCEGYINLISKSEMRDDYHPLVLELN